MPTEHRVDILHEIHIVNFQIKFTAANDDKLKAVITVDKSMCNGYEIMHGGYISLVMDFMCVYGHVAQNGGKLAMTTNFNVK